MSTNQKIAKISNESNFLFLVFQCPYCEKQNVLNKSYLSIEVICSNLGCRRVVVLDLRKINSNHTQINPEIQPIESQSLTKEQEILAASNISDLTQKPSDILSESDGTENSTEDSDAA